jgi:hypothetical protein
VLFFRHWVVAASLALPGSLVAGSSTPEEALLGVPEPVRACVAELLGGVDRGAERATPGRPPRSMATLLPMGSAALSLRAEQALSNGQQRLLELDRAFAAFESSGLLAVAVAEEIEASGRASLADFRAALNDFPRAYPDRASQVSFLDGVAQRLLLRLRFRRDGTLHRLESARRPVDADSLARLGTALAQSDRSGFAELELYVLHRVLQPSDAFQAQVLGERRGWAGRLWRRFRSRPLARVVRIGVPDDLAAPEPPAPARRTFLGELNGASPEARDFFVARNLYVLPVSYLELLREVRLGVRTRELIDRRLDELEEEAVASDVVRQLGVSPEEAREAFRRRRGGFPDYLVAREAGATHPEALDVLEWVVLGKLRAADYARIREGGVAHALAIAYPTFSAQCAPEVFSRAMARDVTVEELREANRFAIALDVYVPLRERGLEHGAILAAASRGALSELERDTARDGDPRP